ARAGVIPIIGDRKFSQFEDNMHCLDWSLDARHVARLDEVSRIELGFPLDFLHRKEVREFLHGGCLSGFRGDERVACGLASMRELAERVGSDSDLKVSRVYAPGDGRETVKTVGSFGRWS